MTSHEMGVTVVLDGTEHRFPHRVPEGAVIPKGVMYAFRTDDGLVLRHADRDVDTFKTLIERWTKIPMERKIQLPTETLAEIRNVKTVGGESYNVMVLNAAGFWTGVGSRGGAMSLTPANIITFELPAAKDERIAELEAELASLTAKVNGHQ